MAAPLPGVLAEIAEVAGYAAALEVALAHGGEDAFHIPRPEYLAHERGHPLVALLGLEAARAVARRCGGGPVYIPRARRALVAYLADQGRTTAEIAVRLGLSRRTARRYRRGGV